MKDDLATYYARRAPEYERVYEKPERQADIKYLINFLQQTFREQTVIEVACGTGYWTQHIAQTARSVVATDVSPEVLKLAKEKQFSRQNVSFGVANIYALPVPKPPFDAVFGGFIWSHIPLLRLPDFLLSVHRTIKANSKVVFVDNRYVAGNSTPVAKQDTTGNTYQKRKLSTGEEHLVLKNFPSESAIRNALEPYAFDIEIRWLTYFWIVTYRTLNASANHLTPNPQNP